MLKAPAVKNMSVEQLGAVVEMGERVARGEVNLWEMDEISLKLRGKQQKGGTKRKREGEAKMDARKMAKTEENTQRTDGQEAKREVEGGLEEAESEVRDEDSVSPTQRGAGDEQAKDQASHGSPTDSGIDLEQKPDPTALKQEQQPKATTPNGPQKVPQPPTEPQPPPGKKTRKAHMADIWSTFHPSPSSIPPNKSPSRTNLTPKEADDLARARAAIHNDSSISHYRQHVLQLLTQVPKGRWSTYQILADAAVRIPPPSSTTPTTSSSPSSNPNTSSKSKRGNARAVGSAMRNNPLAPTVPCHRILATGGRLGGFGGEWGDEGRFASEKRRLLREEGVGFDGKGKVLGRAWEGFESYECL